MVYFETCLHQSELTAWNWFLLDNVIAAQKYRKTNGSLSCSHKPVINPYPYYSFNIHFIIIIIIIPSIIIIIIIIIIISLDCKWVIPGGSGTTIRHNTQKYTCHTKWHTNNVRGGAQFM
jgi:hypothetical protein